MSNEVWFDMVPVTSESRMVLAPDFHTALAVYDALCARFCCVVLFDDNGERLRNYDNRP